MRRNQRGFTLIELLVVIVIIGILAAMALPNFVKAREKAKEAEVKANIHSIQIALERYAVDTGGTYPLILYGGDPTDTFSTYKSPAPIDFPDYQYFPGDIDVLLEFGYLGQYPQNPFYRNRNVEKYGKIITNPGENGINWLEHGIGRVNIWSRPRRRDQEYIRREVGGERGTLMWEISEGQRHVPWPIIVVPPPPPHPSYGFDNPTPGTFLQNATNYRDDYQFWLTPGNFYYYALFDGVGCYSSFVNNDPQFPIQGSVIGFKLCGYGTIWNPGQDYYNLLGDFPERSLFTVNIPLASYDSALDTYVGPDDRPDGVIIVVESGVDTHTPQGTAEAGKY